MERQTLFRALLLAFMMHAFSLHAQTNLKRSTDINGLRYELSPNPSEWRQTLSLAQNSPLSRSYVLVSFAEIPKLQAQQALERSGLHLLEYYSDGCYLASIDGSAQTHQLQSKGLLHLSPLQPKMIQAEEIWSEAWPAHIMKSGNRLQLDLGLATDLSNEDMNWLSAQIPGEILKTNLWLRNLKVEIDARDLQALSLLPGIISVFPVEEEPYTEGHNANNLHRSNALISSVPGTSSYTGEGVVAAIGDNGKVLDHIDYQNRVTNLANGNPGNHAEMCAGVLAGAGNLNPLNSGHAPKAELRIYRSYNVLSNMPAPYDNNGVRITSHSLGARCNGQYNSATRGTDLTTWNRKGLLNVFSAGNEGTRDCGYVQTGFKGWGNITGGRKIAKNCITVGGTNDTDGIYGNTSRGPSSDGRLKPEVVANATNVLTTKEGNLYGGPSGTSMACPAVAGILAQMIDAWDDTHSGDAPAALLKGILMNTAEDLGNPGPDFKYGYGRVNALRAVRTLVNNQYVTGTLSQGLSNTHALPIPANAKEVRVMLCWTDRPASSGATDVLINDLDLSGSVGASNFLPWVLDYSPSNAALSSNATHGVDSRNNHEQIIIENTWGTAATLNLMVNGTEIPNGQQTYYLSYEFIYNKIEVTYPTGGEAWVPGELKTIYWDAYGDQGTFQIDFSTDNGAVWTPLVASVPGNKRMKEITVPTQLTGDALVRVRRNAISDQSDAPFSIMNVPSNLGIEWACDNLFMGTWDPTPGANGYDVYQLNNRYMTLIGSTPDAFYTFSLPGNGVESWFAVVAKAPNGAQSRRSLAKKKPQGSFQCSTMAPVAAFSANQREVCKGSSVTFTDESHAGIVTGWAWNFGTGATPSSASGPGPHTVTYNSPGLQTVSLQVFSPFGSNILVHGGYMDVVSGGTASVSLMASPASVCEGEMITLSVDPTLGGNPSYDWYLNGQLYGNFGEEISGETFADGDQIQVRMHSNLGCVTGNPTNSNPVTLVVNPWINPDLKLLPSGLVCKGVPTTFNAVYSSGAYNFEWLRNGLSVATNVSSYTDVFLEGEVLELHAKFAGDCLNEEALTTAPFTIVFDPSCTPTPKTNYMGSFKVYPNPSTAGFTLELPRVAESVKASLYDTQGRLLQVFELQPGKSLKIGSNLSQGVYMLKLDGNEGISTHRLVKLP